MALSCFICPPPLGGQYQKDIVYPKGKGKTTGSLGIISNWLADGYPAAMNAKL